jgi:alpha-amylase
MGQIDAKFGGAKILRTVPFEKGFHFTTEKGVDTGITATSLSDFADKLETIDVNSVMFHYSRGDFQKWMHDTLGDKALSNQLCFVEPESSGEKVRKQLLRMVRKRLTELQKQQ